MDYIRGVQNPFGMDIVISKATQKGKKLQAQFIDGHGNVKKTVAFGALGYQDYTMHHDEERKKRYLKRHLRDGTAIESAGALSRDLLWSKPNLKEAVFYAQKKHGRKIILKK